MAWLVDLHVPADAEHPLADANQMQHIALQRARWILEPSYNLVTRSDIRLSRLRWHAMARTA